MSLGLSTPPPTRRADWGSPTIDSYDFSRPMGFDTPTPRAVRNAFRPPLREIQHDNIGADVNSLEAPMSFLNRAPEDDDDDTDNAPMVIQNDTFAFKLNDTDENTVPVCHLTPRPTHFHPPMSCFSSGASQSYGGFAEITGTGAEVNHLFHTPQPDRSVQNLSDQLEFEISAHNPAPPRPRPDLVTAVTSSIFLGEWPSGNTFDFLAQNQITSIVNCCSSDKRTPYTLPAGFRYFPIPALDEPKYDILENHYNSFARDVGALLAQDKKVFVHCRGGINRSVALVVAFLVAHSGMPLIDAIKLFRDNGRLYILDNPGFRKLLVLHALAQPE